MQADEKLEDPVLVNDWHVVAWSEDVREGDPVSASLLGMELVLWRTEEEVLAWRDLCLHRGTRLSMGEIENGTLKCPYHGWKYNDEGRCVEIPAHPDQPPPSDFTVEQYEVREQYDMVWVCLGDAHQDVPSLDEWGDDEFRLIRCGPYHFDAAAPRCVENFLDVAHFPFVHEGTLGDQDRPEIPDFEVETHEHGILARDVPVWQPNPDGTGEGGYVHYTYETRRALTAYFKKGRGDNHFAIFATVTPVNEAKSKMWMWITMNYGDETDDEEIRAFQDQITREDIPIVESQRPELLPLDLQAELHRPADRCSIAYRKWLRKEGLTFGTA